MAAPTRESARLTAMGHQGPPSMVVSLLQFRLDLGGIESIKDKRRVVASLKQKLQNRFRLSVAEVDFQDSLHRAQLGAALVSNSKSFGESVLHKALAFVERAVPGRLADAEIFSEHY